MIRGTTPTLTFSIPFDTSKITDGYITFVQQKFVVIDKPISDCKLDGNVITITLTQEETLKFQTESDVEIQITVKIDDRRISSNIVTMDVDRVLHGGII